MIDLKLLREQPELYKEAIRKKRIECDIDAILELDARRRTVISEFEQARSAQKAANNEMAGLPKGSPEFQEKVQEMRALAQKVKELQAQQDKVEADFKAAVLVIPNIPDPSVPVGENDDANVVLSTTGDVNAVSAHAVAHWDIAWFEQLCDLKRGAKVTGAGFPFFIGDMARLVRALLQFFLNENTAAGYTEIMPPLLVNPDSATATGQLPDKEGQMYHVTGDDLYLIPTSEVPTTNFYRNDVFELKQLPLNLTSYSPNFRREAGSYGKDVRGLNRVHQFDKVELVKWVHPDTSAAELDCLVEQAASLLVKLGLPFRNMLMATHDLGPPHAKKIDLEVWAAGQQRWLEVSSCSNFTDYQARRANIRFRDEDGKLQFVHTLNGSGLAVPRVLAAILESNHNADGTVTVPEVLRSGVGKDTIGG